MKQTALYRNHLLRNAKMADHQGWQTPALFSDATGEYHAVRTMAGLFDAGHLGRIELSGAEAEEFMQPLFTRNVARLTEGASAYGLMLNEAGGILDDCILFKLAGDRKTKRYLLTTNAVNTDKILAWLRKHGGSGLAVRDRTAELAHLALQGPRAEAFIEQLAAPDTKKIKHHRMKEITINGKTVMASRTGFTGERGYELFIDAERAEALWDEILAAGKEYGLLPCGLISRDMLRIEMGYVLYGADIDETRTPLEAGLSGLIDFSKDFIGKEALLERKARGVDQQRIGFELFDKGIPKSGASIYSENREIGAVTSGNHSPHRRHDIGIGYVVSRYAQPGQEIEIEIKDREVAAKIIELPFYRHK